MARVEGNDHPLPTDVIRLLIDANPKRVGSKSLKRFDCYADGMTVDDYQQAIFNRLGPHEATKVTDDLEWDSERGFITIERHGKTIQLSVRQSFQRT